MSRWEQTLDAQTSLLEFWRSERGPAYERGFLTDVAEKHPDSMTRHVVEGLAAREAGRLEVAAPVAVEEEVMALIDAAAGQLGEQDWSFHAEDLFQPWGFALLPSDIDFLDSENILAGVRAFSWGLAPVEYHDRETGAVTKRDVQLQLTYYSHDEGPDQRWPTDEMELRELRRYFNGPLSMLHAMIVPFDEKLEFAGGQVGTVERWIFAFFMLASQEVIRQTEAQAPRGARKRAKRAGIDDERVLVVTLRRYSAPSEGGEPSDVDWTRRWLVGSHWRRQWYPSLGRHRMKWIAPYVKGPEDKPLVLHAGRAYEFKR